MSIEVVMVILMFGLYLALLFTGFPVAFVLAGTGIFIAVLGEILLNFDIRIGVNINYLGLVVNRVWGVMSNTGLVAVPLFILMGYALELGGVARQLMNALSQIMTRVPGGLALSVVIIGIVLAASTGVIGAALILLGTLAIKPMLDANYPPEMALGVIAASGCLGILIPPSIMLIVLGDQLQLPVGDLFMGAIIPGLLLGGLYAIYVMGASILGRNVMAVPARPTNGGGAGPISALLALLGALVPPLVLIVAVLGSIYFGIATPTEAAGVGALGALLLAAANRRLGWKEIKMIGEASVRTNAFVFAIFLGATCFALVLRGIGGDHVIRNAALGLELGPSAMVILILAVVFVLGFFLDWIEISLIIVPIVRPILMELDVDRLWFAILLAVCLQTSFLTPPMGPALFYVKALAPDNIRLQQVYRGVLPFVAIQILGLVIVMLFPELATWLPMIAYASR